MEGFHRDSHILDLHPNITKFQTTIHTGTIGGKILLMNKFHIGRSLAMKLNVTKIF